MSTAVQWAVGNRLIGEFLIHWTFLIGAVLVGFHLAVRLSGSVIAALATSLLVVTALAATPTHTFPKLFFYPVAVLLAWWYMDQPGVRRAAVLGLITAIAFLYRHDHGIYIGIASVLAFGLTRLITSGSRDWRTSWREVAAYTLCAALPILPWAAVVQANEGFVDYVRMRAEWNQTWAPDESPYAQLRDFNPAPVLAGRQVEDEEQWLLGYLPPRETAEHWLVQISLLVPILVLLAVALHAVRRVRRGERIGADTSRPLLAAALACIVADRLFRQDSYFLTSMPLTAALGAYLLMPSPLLHGRPWAAIARAVRHVVAIACLLVTGVAVVGFVDELRLLSPITGTDDLPIGQLMTSPPIDAFAPGEYARQMKPAEWAAMDRDRKQRIMMRYMHDCTREGDRLIVTGSTPYQVGYYVERPIAGGHLQWHHRWRDDPAHELQSLRMIESQSVPFAFSTHDPVMEDFKAYPRIHAYLAAHYVELEGSDGLLLMDSRRTPTGTFGTVGFPCFR